MLPNRSPALPRTPSLPPKALPGENMEIYDDILQTLGNTPLVRLDRYFSGEA